QGEVGVDVPGGLEQAVDGALHVLPQGVAGGPDDHAPADVRILGQLGPADDVEVPLAVVGGARRDLFVVGRGCTSTPGCGRGGLLFLVAALGLLVGTHPGSGIIVRFSDYRGVTRRGQLR